MRRPRVNDDATITLLFGISVQRLACNPRGPCGSRESVIYLLRLPEPGASQQLVQYFPVALDHEGQNPEDAHLFGDAGGFRASHIGHLDHLEARLLKQAPKLLGREHSPRDARAT